MKPKRCWPVWAFVARALGPSAVVLSKKRELERLQDAFTLESSCKHTRCQVRSDVEESMWEDMSFPVWPAAFRLTRLHDFLCMALEVHVSHEPAAPGHAKPTSESRGLQPLFPAAREDSSGNADQRISSLIWSELAVPSMPSMSRSCMPATFQLDATTKVVEYWLFCFTR